MTRRMMLVVAVCLLLLGLDVEGQSPQRLRVRLHRKPVTPPAVGVVVSIDSPTALPTWTHNASTITLCGTASSTNGPVTGVTWTNSRGGSGTATGTTDWCITPGGASTAIIFQDDFNQASTVALQSHTPTPGPGSWTRDSGPVGTNANNNGGTDSIKPSASTNSASLQYTFTPTTPLSGTNYLYQATVAEQNTGSDDALVLRFGITGTTECVLTVYPSVASPDLALRRIVSGVATDLATADVTTAVGQVYAVRVNGTAITVTKDGSTVFSTTDTTCDDSTTLGVGWGAASGVATDDIMSSTAWDTLILTDYAAAGGGLVLQTGAANRVTVTATDSTAATGNDFIDITYSVSDAIPPSATIEFPTTGSTYATSTAAMTVSGSATDNTGVTAVAWTCPTCTPTSGGASGTTSWTLSLTLGCSSAPGVDNTITVTASDAAANTGADVLVATCTTSDVTVPTITITSPTSSPTYNSASTPLTVGGTASDNVGLASVVCASSLTGSVTAIGTTTWSASMALLPSSSNVITCTATDLSGNVATDVLTVTYAPALTIATGSPLPTGTDNVAYSVTFSATGGMPPYTWSEAVALSSDADCAGLTFTSGGLLSGTPTAPVGAPVTCTWTARVTDSAPTQVDKAMSITINQAGAAGPYDYWNNWLAHGNCYRAYSLRPQPGNPNPSHTSGCTSPNYTNQLLIAASGGYLAGSAAIPIMMTYNYAGDTDPQKQDALKFSLPPFHPTQSMTLATAIEDAATTVITTNESIISNGFAHDYLIDGEIFACFHPDPARWCVGGNLRSIGGVSQAPDYASRTMYVTRGQFGSAAVPHSAGAGLFRSNNSNTNQPYFPIDTSDGHTYFIAIDTFYANSWLKSGLTSHKGFQLRLPGTGRFFETRPRFNGGASCGIEPTFDVNLHVAVVDARIYNELGGPATWTDSTGNQIGPQGGGAAYTSKDPLCPMSTPRMLLKPGKWYRWYWFLDQKANDYDPLTLWVQEEGGAATLIYDSAPVSVPPSSGFILKDFNLEFNTSTDHYTRGIVGGTPDGMRNLVMYMRHLGVMRDLTRGQAEALLTAPVPGN